MRVLALVIALAALPVAAADQAAILMLRVWIDAVDHHSAGEADAAVDALNAWTYNDLAAMRPYVEFLVLAPAERDAQRTTRRERLTKIDRVAIDELRRSGLPSG